MNKYFIILIILLSQCSSPPPVDSKPPKTSDVPQKVPVPIDKTPLFYKFRGAFRSDTINLYLYVNTVAAHYCTGIMVNERTGVPTNVTGTNQQGTDFTSIHFFDKPLQFSNYSEITLFVENRFQIYGNLNSSQNFNGTWMDADNTNYITEYFPISLENKTKDIPKLTPICFNIDSKVGATLINGVRKHNLTINAFKLNNSKEEAIYKSIYSLPYSKKHFQLLEPTMTHEKWDKVNLFHSVPYIAFVNEAFVSGYIAHDWFDKNKGYLKQIPFIYDMKAQKKLGWRDIATPANEANIKKYLKKHQSHYSDTPLEAQIPFVTHKGLVWIHYPEKTTKDLEEPRLEYIPFSEISTWIQPDFLSKINP